jgi:hypothetical protein
VPKRILLDVDDTEDRIHGGQRLTFFKAYTTASLSESTSRARRDRCTRNFIARAAR